MSFNDHFSKMKKEIGALDDQGEFYANLYANYNTKIKFIVKNYLIQFDIIQKNMNKLSASHFKVLKEEKDSKQSCTDSNLNFLLTELAKHKKTIVESAEQIKNVMVALESNPGQETKDKLLKAKEGFLKQFNQSVISLDATSSELNINLVRSGYDIAFYDYTIILKTFLTLVKMMRELKEHSDIQESFLCVVDEEQVEMMETL